MAGTVGFIEMWRRDGAEIEDFEPNSYWVHAMAFSPDGKHLLIGAESPDEAVLLDMKGGEKMTFPGHHAAVKAVAFSPDGKYVLTGSIDSTARLWNLEGTQLQVFNGLDGHVNSVAFSPACPDDPTGGKYILTGNAAKTAKLWDRKGKEIQTFKGYSQYIRAVAISADGKFALTGSDDNIARLWDLGGKEVKALIGHTAPVDTVAFSPDGKFVLTGSRDSMVKWWDMNGKEIQTLTGHAPFVSSVTISPDGKNIPSGSKDFTAKLKDLNGKEIQTFTGHADVVSSLACSPDRKFVMTGSWDNTTKLWEMESGRELATMVSIDSTDWVVTTPSGLFDASPGAMRLMHFVVGLEAIELEQLKERYYEPGFLAKVMGFSDEPLREAEGFDSVGLYPAVRLVPDTLQNKLHIRLTPRNGGVGKVSVFVNGKEVVEEANKVRIKGFERTRDTTMTINLEQYARYFLIDTLNTVSIRAYNEAGWLKSAPHSMDFWSVPIRAKGAGQKTGAAPLRKNRRPALYVVAVGTADYAGAQLDLNYSGKDAIDVAGALGQIGAKLFSPDSVFVQLLTTDTSDTKMQPTRANIKAAFDAIKTRAKAEDMLVVYFSGHGVAYNALFYYLTMEAGSFNLGEDADAGVLGKRTVSSNELTRWINDIPAQKQVLILDACNSGKVVENLAGGQKSLNASQIRALDRMKDRTGMFVLTGSAADKVSYEAGQFGQGLLTYSLLQGMEMLGNKDDRRIDVMRLFQYARDEVPNLAKGIGGIQTPMLATPLGGGSFDIGLADSSVHIPIAQVKPVFIRNVFQDEDNFDDVLGLTNALKDHFNELTARGDENLIYVDVSEYDNAYSIKGLYRISGDAVEVRGRLFKGKTSKGGFQVTGKKSDLPGLVEAIVEKVSGMIE